MEYLGHGANPPPPRAQAAGIWVSDTCSSSPPGPGRGKELGRGSSQGQEGRGTQRSPPCLSSPPPRPFRPGLPGQSHASPLRAPDVLEARLVLPPRPPWPRPAPGSCREATLTHSLRIWGPCSRPQGPLPHYPLGGQAQAQRARLAAGTALGAPARTWQPAPPPSKPPLPHAPPHTGPQAPPASLHEALGV